MNEIRFYGRKLTHFEFSNFWNAKIVNNDLMEMFCAGGSDFLKSVKLHESYANSEALYQSLKFYGSDPAQCELIANVKTGREAADNGRDKSKAMRPDWDDVKDDAMRLAIFGKYTQHEYLMKILLDTEDTILIEHTVNDSYWGNGGGGNGFDESRGKNMLGKLLMELRTNLRQTKLYFPRSLKEYMQ